MRGTSEVELADHGGFELEFGTGAGIQGVPSTNTIVPLSKTYLRANLVQLDNEISGFRKLTGIGKEKGREEEEKGRRRKKRRRPADASGIRRCGDGGDAAGTR